MLRSLHHCVLVGGSWTCFIRGHTGQERTKRLGGGGFPHRTCSTASYPAGGVGPVQTGKLSVPGALCAMLKKGFEGTKGTT